MSNKSNKLKMNDRKRWKDSENFKSEWSSRVEMMSSLIPDKSSVIEFGIGVSPISNFNKVNNLSKYTPTDFVRRDPPAIIYDLNSDELIDFEPHDIAVFSGVLEYINKLPVKIEFISKRVDQIITSYSTLEKYPDNREIRGWINSYTDGEFINIFTKVGFFLKEKYFWKNQTIYVFVKEND